MNFHEIPYEERLELFYDYLMRFSTVLLLLDAEVKKSKNPELDEIAQKLKKAIEELRDFVLEEKSEKEVRK